MNESNATFESRTVVFKVNMGWLAALATLFLLWTLFPRWMEWITYDFFLWLHTLILTHLK